jgi:hypothetical protein
MSARRLIVLISAAAALAGWYYGIYGPTRQQLETVDRQILDAETQLRDYQSTIAQVPLLLRASSELGDKKRRQNSVLFAKQDILKMFDQVTREAQGERMSVVEITPPLSELLTLNAARKNPGEALFLNLTIRVMGDYVGSRVSPISAASTLS